MVITLILLAKLYYVTKNKIREKKWSAMTPQVCLNFNSYNLRTLRLLIEEKTTTYAHNDPGTHKLHYEYHGHGEQTLGFSIRPLMLGGKVSGNESVEGFGFTAKRIGVSLRVKDYSRR